MSVSHDSQINDAIFDKDGEEGLSISNTNTPDSEFSSSGGVLGKDAGLDSHEDPHASSRRLAATLTLEEQVGASGNNIILEQF